MNNVYAKYDEKFVKTTIVYADADDGHVFEDAGKKTKIDKDTLLRLFQTGMVIMLGNEYFKPIHYKVTSNYAQVDVYDDAGSKTFFSSEKAD